MAQSSNAIHPLLVPVSYMTATRSVMGVSIWKKPLKTAAKALSFTRKRSKILQALSFFVDFSSGSSLRFRSKKASQIVEKHRARKQVEGLEPTVDSLPLINAILTTTNV